MQVSSSATSYFDSLQLCAQPTPASTPIGSLLQRSLLQGKTRSVVRVSSGSLWHLRRRRRQAGAPADQQDAGHHQRHDHERLVGRVAARQRARRDARLRGARRGAARLLARCHQLGRGGRANGGRRAR